MISKSAPPPQWLQICGCSIGGHEECDSADKWEEKEARKHRQDCTVAGLSSGLGGRFHTINFFSTLSHISPLILSATNVALFCFVRFVLHGSVFQICEGEIVLTKSQILSQKYPIGESSAWILELGTSIEWEYQKISISISETFQTWSDSSLLSC